MSCQAWSQETPNVSLDSNPTLFAVLAGMNACGYDHELANSLPLRQEVRTQISRTLRESPQAAAVAGELCQFYKDHKQSDPARELAQYVSLALNLGEPPDFALNIKEADLPPDAAYVQGFVPVLQRFYRSAGVSKLWLAQRPRYEALIDRYHEPVSKLLFETDIYLRQPLSGYVGRSFLVYLEPQGAPSQINARNYGSDYFMVISPGGSELKLKEIRHTYLHFVLDPLALKRANQLRRLEPLLEVVKTAPLDDSYKHDISLLMTESLVRAVEARLSNRGRSEAAEAERQRYANEAMAEGYVLTQHFYEQLARFERDEVGLKDAYGDWLHFVDMNKERRRAASIRFAAKAAPEVVRASNNRQESLVDAAEGKLVVGDWQAAAKLAQQALDSPAEDKARAMFALARAASLGGDMDGARTYFDQTLAVAREPRVVAWSHIYLGRIFDIQQNREAAVQHYQAALKAGDPAPPTRVAAERGLKEPYRAPRPAAQPQPSAPDPQEP